ncbi:unnamed protein product [Rotaria sordida]|uniref:Uncharacterized protein n=1 Tax=Rotaria sordida TaxID=392033 RepID=A0A814J172_9BILA|nr:unnamed protein product [Rotaria sordida]CAF1492489.1 unnamed protein product [Rotaria sordida]
MNASIEEMMVSAYQAICSGQLPEAVELCSKMIFVAEGGEAKKHSELCSYRAGCRLLTKEFNHNISIDGITIFDNGDNGKIFH